MRAVLKSAAVLTGLVAAVLPSAAQNNDIQTGLDEIVIQPLEEVQLDDLGGFVDGFDGLSLDDLQVLPEFGFQQELADITTELQEVVARFGSFGWPR